MTAGQTSGTGAMTELNDNKVRKNDILSNRDKAQRLPGQGLDGKGIQVDEYKDNPANHRPSGDDREQPHDEPIAAKPDQNPKVESKPEKSEDTGQHDRPGFDLGGSSGKTHGGKGLGLGEDAKEEGREEWRLPK